MGGKLMKSKSGSRYKTRVHEDIVHEDIPDEVIPDGAKFVEEVVTTPQYGSKVPDAVSEIRRIKVPECSSHILRTPIKDTVVICTSQDGILVVKNASHKYNITHHRVNHSEKYIGILSGVCVNTETSIVIIGSSVYTIYLDITSNTSTTIELRHKLNAINPVDVFRFGPYKYAVLESNPCSVRVFKLKDILMKESIHSVDTIHLDLMNISFFDKACVGPNGNIYVTSQYGDCVFVCHENGDKLDILGQKRIEPFIVKAGQFKGPRSIECDADGKIIVCCNSWDVHTYSDGQWSLLIGLDCGSYHSVITESRLWIVQKGYIKMFSIHGSL